MKHYLKAEVEGRAFLKTYLIFFIPILILSALSNPEYGSPGGSPFFSLVQSYLSLLLEFAFFCYLITRVTFRNEGFPFDGSLGEFAPKGALWLFLSTITMGIYAPWFIRNLLDYVLGRLSWNGKQALFQGEPRKLLVPMLLLVFLPVLVISIVFALVFIRADREFTGGAIVFAVLGGLLIIVLSLVLTWIYLRWLINFEFSGYRIRFTGEQTDTMLFLLGQILLTIITAGIYGPAAWLRIYRFVAGHTAFQDESGQTKATLGFDGPVGEGFLLFWGQGLLLIITIGFIGPWVMARLSNWVLNRTCLDGDIEF